MRARLRVTAAVLGCAALLMTAACTQSDGTGPAPEPSSPAASPEPTSTLSAAEAKAAEAALAAYRAYRDYVTEAMITGKYDREEMRKFTGEPLLGIKLNSLSRQVEAEVFFQGRPTWSPTVAEIDLQVQPPVVVIQDCFDISGFVPMHNGKPVPEPSNTIKRRLIRMKVKQVSGVWYVYEDASSEGESC